MSYWRDKSRVIISKAIEEGRAQGLEGAALKKHVSQYYPFGERAMHPYKIWLDECKRQLNLKPMPAVVVRDRLPDLPGQGRLF